MFCAYPECTSALGYMQETLKQLAEHPGCPPRFATAARLRIEGDNQCDNNPKTE